MCTDMINDVLLHMFYFVVLLQILLQKQNNLIMQEA